MTPARGARVRLDVSYRRIWMLAWPTVITNMLIASVGLSYVKIVSVDGAAAIAAVTSGHRVFVLIQAVVMGLAIATTALVAQSWGRGDRGGASRWTWQSLYFASAVALMFTGLGELLAPEIAVAMGLQGAARDMLIQFLRVLLLFNIIFAISNVLNAAFRAVGDTRTPMYFTLVSTVLNIALCVVLARGLLGAPSLGIIGIAIGGGVGPLLAFSTMALRWRRNRYLLTGGERPAPRAHAWRDIIRIALPATLEQLVIHGSLIVFMRFVAHYGTNEFAAFGVALSLLSVVVVIGFGFGIANAALTGQCVGAGDIRGALGAMKNTAQLSCGILAVVAILVAVAARPLAQFMAADPAVVDVAVPFLLILAAILPLAAIESALSGGLRGAGDTRFPLWSSLSGMGSRLLLAGMMLTIDAPVTWLYGTLLVDYLLKVSLLVWRVRSMRWLRRDITARA